MNASEERRGERGKEGKGRSDRENSTDNTKRIYYVFLLKRRPFPSWRPESIEKYLKIHIFTF